MVVLINPFTLHMINTKTSHTYALAKMHWVNCRQKDFKICLKDGVATPHGQWYQERGWLLECQCVDGIWARCRDIVAYTDVHDDIWEETASPTASSTESPTASPTASPTSPTASPSPDSDPEPIEYDGEIKLDDALTVDYKFLEDKKSIRFWVRAPFDTFLGFGVSTDGTMTSSGSGSDVFICSDGVVQRYWLTSKAPPSNGVPVFGSCTQEDGQSTMIFSRSLEAESETELAISLEGATNFIYAYGNSEPLETLAYHGANRGSVSFNS